MFYLGADNVFRSTLLDKFSWLKHGFGTARSREWPGDYTQVKQIHSDMCLIAHGQNGSIGRADGLILAEEGIVGVRTADCLPLLIADRENRIVAAVHAGWRGTAQNIAGKAVARMRENFGCRPESLVVALGPAIGECCFEVGPEVEREFRSWFPNKPATRHVNLAEANRLQLVGAGVAPENIDISDRCTKCGSNRDPNLFHSFRRDKEAAGRMVAAIGIV